MLSFISWSQFLTAVALLLIIYYLAVLAIGYRTEVLRLFRSTGPKPHGLESENKFTDRPMWYNEMTAATGKEDPFLSGKVHELLQDLKGLLAAAAQSKVVKAELCMAIQLPLKEYSILKNLPLIAEINHHILSECQNTCSITLSDAEMNMLWNG